MKYNISEAVKRNLKENYEKDCNAYLVELLNMWDLSYKDGFWVGNEVGGLYSHGDSIFISMENIIYCVENAVGYDTFFEWSEYCLWAIEFNQNTPNLKSWCMGCPRVDEATQKMLTTKKLEFEELVRKTKERF